ncbi:CRISPR-associated endonuclease Cas1 [Telmatocola sphagniphila]|uniref:CRISPR-associated endonuclease Cas1 n=1 Tax=Telmatocola sphagniphila TaxID=1123043 RepID=A0A8E6ETJ1_9BACT|nr:CRISPR-associated endonuclease Cas1 [Telmatocola sphagniphila]QVL30007.1 CRISPR-associated endonuclease Cas1 [Telmatocola sphagniphila]
MQPLPRIDDQPVPLRMLNEFTYCPRLGYLEWVQGEWADSHDTLHGEFIHRNVDREDKKAIPEAEELGEDSLHARSLRLENAELGLVALVDVLELDGGIATPVDYKRGSVPDNAEHSWEPERVQICAQGLLLRAAGYNCSEGILYYSASKRRISIPFDEPLVRRTRDLIAEFRRVAQTGQIPPPLVDSPKCPRCSLVGICLPDETRLLANLSEESLSSEDPEKEVSPSNFRPPRAALIPRSDELPLHVTEQGARLCKDGERLAIEYQGERLGSFRLIDISQVCVYGNIQMTSQALAELVDRDIPICYFTQGGYFRGITHGLSHRNVELRIRQYAVAGNPHQALIIARAFIAGKIRNCRTILRRNRRKEEEQSLDDPFGNPTGEALPPSTTQRETDGVIERLKHHASEALRAESLESLMGTEGMAAKLYFGEFAKLLKNGLHFEGRNRRPPTDPVNATLSFLYALLAKECHVALQATGFDPMLGFLHRPRYGRPSLALDLAEEFRPLIADSTALSLLNTGELSKTHFVQRAGACSLIPTGRKALLTAWERRLSGEITHPVFGYVLSYRRVIALQARLLGRFLLGEIPAYPAFKTR